MSSANLATAAEQLLSLSTRLGVSFIFVNLGSDHPAFIEAFALLHEGGGAMPKIISCPHETSALAAAHGYAMITRRPQIVLVHVDVGTQNLGGSVHNACRGRIPAIIIAGLSPLTDRGERIGERNEFIHYIQDTPRQHEIVGQYMKWCYELRAPETVDAVLLRGWQMAVSEPQGPVYITGAREIWEERIAASREPLAHWPAAATAGLPEGAASEICQALGEAKRPLLITTYLGRQPKAVARLVELSERYGFGICEVGPQYMSFPGEHEHHLGYRRNTLIDEADLILMMDVDAPWITSKVKPAEGCRLIHIDIDPIKDGLGFWHFPAEQSYLADSLKALTQLLDISAPVQGRQERIKWISAAKKRLQAKLAVASEAITPDELTEAVRELVNERTVIVFETPSCTESIPSVLKMNRPGSYFASGGSNLGWGINAAIGAKLADPESEVITLAGDGCFVFGVPSSAYWMAGAYNTPHLTVIYNNGGWCSPKMSTLGVHPEGTARQNDHFWVTVGRGARLADIAEATGGAAAFAVKDRADLKVTLKAALQTVRAGRSAVVDVTLAAISGQVLN